LEFAPGTYEVIGRRSANAKHYALPDGTFRMILTPEGMPQHWWDGVAWRDFDLTFRAVQAGEANGGFPFTCQEHGLRTWVMPQSPMGEVVRVEHDGVAMVWSPMQIGQEGNLATWGATLPAVPSGSVVSIDYVGSGGVQSIYTLLRNGLKHDVVLPQAPSATLFGGADFVMSWVVMIEGASAVTGDGAMDLRRGGETTSVLVVGPDARGGLRITAPVIEDGAGRTFIERDSGARYRVLHQGGDLFSVELRVPMAWMTAAERAWPLRIDPSVFPDPNNNCVAGSGMTNAVGTVDNTWYAQSFLWSLDVNHDNGALINCTNVNNARTFAWAKYSPAYTAPQGQCH
jgi:hypothetical protein